MRSSGSVTSNPLQQRRNATASSEEALPFTGRSQSAFFHDIAMGIAVRGRTLRRFWRRGLRLQDEKKLGVPELQEPDSCGYRGRWWRCGRARALQRH
jgi:hypothetical protein